MTPTLGVVRILGIAAAIALPCFSFVLPARAHAQRTHKLPATPQTVAYGYYWAEKAPALRIASGDIIDVETLLTNRPDRLEAAGVPPGEIEQSCETSSPRSPTAVLAATY